MVFVLATYGEGNPIDNANTFFDTFQPESCEEQQARQTEILCMRSWEYHLRLYTRSVAVVDEKFTAAGAEKLGYIGKADKTGCPTTTEEAFSQWKEDMFHILGQRFGRKERAGYDLGGPRAKLSGSKILIHVRASAFKLPANPSRPTIVVGAGTGIAPFHGFVQEWTKLVAAGKDVGRILLFFGCWSASEDFLYADDWSRFQQAELLEVVTAFLREGGSKEKVYVRWIRERKEELVRILVVLYYLRECGHGGGYAKCVGGDVGKGDGVNGRGGGEVCWGELKGGRGDVSGGCLDWLVGRSGSAQSAWWCRG
ncbi:NADPH-cytochrome P450 reductase [Hypocenomyce scalaris]|nr:NADPH-cytochrome P450 reductase [Hypocenomyce scalaris]